MKTFPANFQTEKNKKTGITPLWILKCPFPSSGTVYLSDQVFTVAGWNGGITTKSWIRSWGQIDEDISGEMAMSRVSDFAVEIINDPNATPNIDAILWNAANNIETTDCELYLWFAGLDASTNPPQLMWVGDIIDFEKLDELIYGVQLVDQSVRLDKYIGQKITLADYPSADPDDVGKVKNILYGAVSKVPAHAVDAGAKTSLPANINATATNYNISDGTRLSAGKTIQIDSEEIYIVAISGNNITNCTRGYNSTIAAAHLKGAVVWEKKTHFVYLWADHAVKSIGGVFGKFGDLELDIAAICTKYTGQTGSELAGYEGKAVITVPGYITVQQAIDLLVSHDIEVDTTTFGVTDNIVVSDINLLVDDNIVVTDNIVPVNPNHTHTQAVLKESYFMEQYDINSGSWVLSTAASCNGNFNDGGVCGTTDTDFRIITPKNPGGAPSRIRIGINHSDATYANIGDIKFYLNGSLKQTISLNGAASKTTNYSSWYTLASFAYINASNTYIKVVSNDTLRIWELWYEVEYDPSTSSTAQNTSKTGNAYKASGKAYRTGNITQVGNAYKYGSIVRQGDVYLSGNSVANTLVGDEILISGEGHQDDSSGTYTGTPNALIERPDYILKHFLNVYGGWMIENFYTNAGAQFASKGYELSVAINEYKTLKEWVSYMAFQCRCYFRFASGKAQLLWRPDSLTSQKTITANMIGMDSDTGKTSTRGPRPSPLMEVINKINLHFYRDWSLSGDGAYRGISKDSNAPSITKYGEKEKPELFFFDFVTDQTMADDLRDFYIARYKDRKKVLEMDIFLDNSELEFTDAVTIAPQGNLLCEVAKANTYPGSGRDDRNDRITLTVKEY